MPTQRAFPPSRRATASVVLPVPQPTSSTPRASTAIGLRRLYGANVLERLALVTLGRAAGFSLDEIARMFSPDGRPRIDRHVLAAKADELDRTIRELSAMRDGRRRVGTSARAAPRAAMSLYHATPTAPATAQ
jgi:DNA-binding transcriptional MerR regulator